MDIDWLTVFAQIVNFLVLVWLLQHFLYRPVIDAMDRREKRIADRLEEAQQREQTATQKARLYENKRFELEQSSKQRLQEAETAAQQHRVKLLEQSRDEIQQQRDQWQQQLQQEQQDYLRALRKNSVQAIQQTGRHILADLADTELEAQIIAVFLKRLTNMDDDLRQKLQNSASRVDISSAFDLDDATQNLITQIIHQQLNESATVKYKQSSDLVCGILLKAGDYQVSWNLENHLQMLDEQLQNALNGGTVSDA
ncbi:MAG: F0F1 ATP synthase subunit B [Gammaproteobacteria bacterium]|nr:F0F1 ATP synthase subunit B [Gammaproteobacteria bacterium]